MRRFGGPRGLRGLRRTVRRRVRRFRRGLRDAKSRPDLMDRTVQAAIDDWRPRDAGSAVDSARGAQVRSELSRAVRVLQQTYEDIRRGAGLLVPFVLLKRARLRLGRLRVHLAPTFATGAAGLETLHGFVAAVVLSAMLAGAPGTAPASRVVQTSGHLARAAGLTAPGRGAGAAARTPIAPSGGIDASLSSDSVLPAAPASADAEASVGDDEDRIGVGREVGVTVGDDEYRVGQNGSLVWISCKPDSIVLRTTCWAYRTVEATVEEPPS
ncbi:MAG TPA: hypothetical protein VGB83_10355 [Actinomycetota bacterium]